MMICDAMCFIIAVPPYPELVRSAALRPHRPSYCGWPGVSSEHEVSRLMDCMVLCIETEDCLYINVRQGDTSITCHVTSFTAAESTLPEDADQWTNYLVAP